MPASLATKYKPPNSPTSRGSIGYVVHGHGSAVGGQSTHDGGADAPAAGHQGPLPC